MSATTSDPLVLWLVITGSALGTGLVLWLLKLLIDSTSAPAEPARPATPVPAPPLWPPIPTPHAHTAACTGETVLLTAVQASRARHAKRDTP